MVHFKSFWAISIPLIKPIIFLLRKYFEWVEEDSTLRFKTWACESNGKYLSSEEDPWFLLNIWVGLKFPVVCKKDNELHDHHQWNIHSLYSMKKVKEKSNDPFKDIPTIVDYDGLWVLFTRIRIIVSINPVIEKGIVKFCIFLVLKFVSYFQASSSISDTYFIWPIYRHMQVNSGITWPSTATSRCIDLQIYGWFMAC